MCLRGLWQAACSVCLPAAAHEPPLRLAARSFAILTGSWQAFIVLTCSISSSLQHSSQHQHTPQHSTAHPGELLAKVVPPSKLMVLMLAYAE